MSAKNGDYEALLSEAQAYIQTGITPWEIETFGSFPLLANTDEWQRASTIRDALLEYAKLDKPARPLCIAVFGPPGSGKSTIVKAALAEANDRSNGRFEDPVTVNLSRMQDSWLKFLESKLSGPIEKNDPASKSTKQAQGVPVEKKATENSNEDLIPVVFFDEFDTARLGVSLGWLQTFLAPMESFEGIARRTKHRAILVFAGGTAETLQDFETKTLEDPADYRNKKVPDFISRLFAHLNVSGINGEPEERIRRRALSLRFQLKNREFAGQNGQYVVDAGLVNDLLLPTHYIHNQRSLQSVIELAKLKDEKTLNYSNFPGGKDTPEFNSLLRAHVNRGSFDGKIIGLSTWQMDNELQDLAREFAEKLVLHGATIAFGGDLNSQGILPSLVEIARKAPKGLLGPTSPLIHNYLAYPSYLRDEVKNEIRKLESTAGEIIKFIRLKTLSEEELACFGIALDEHFDGRAVPYCMDSHLAWSISLFRMRRRMIQDLDALIVFGGKVGESWGRCSGIAEEVMLAIALGKPVYLVSDRAADLVGQLVGLGPLASSNVLRAGGTERYVRALRENAACFAIPDVDPYPVSEDEVMDFLLAHQVGSRGWIDNGLTRLENISLFELEPQFHSEKIVSLVIKGLKRVMQPRLS